MTLVLAGLTAAFNLVLSERLDNDAKSVAMARASAELAALKVAGSRVTLAETSDAGALDSPIWVFERKRALERPRESAANQRAAAALAGGPRRFYDVPSTDTRLYALPIVQRTRRIGTVVSAISLRAYAQTRHTALVASIVLAALALVAIAVAANWLISRALRPVAQMTRQAGEWSDHDPGRRFSLGEPHDELTQLASTLDGLLDRLAASLRHEQRLTAELSHELRTPLAHITAEAQYALHHVQDTDEYRGYEQILESAARMSRTLETIIAAARAQLDPRRATCDATAVAHSAAETCGPVARDHGINVEVSGPPVHPRVAAEPDLVERILAPLLENACRFARETVRIEVERYDAGIRYVVDDDGPGVHAAALQTIFEPGYSDERRGATSVATRGAGLGLSLARRLARAAGGDVTAADSDSGGRFIVCLPSA
jgi:signal transduction histidine kinase